MERPSGGSFEAAARDLIHRYADSILRSDADANRELWDEQATAMPPDVPMVSGKQAIWEMFRAAFQRVSYRKFDIDLKEIHGSGDLGFVRGNYTYTVCFKADDKAADREGKFLTVFRRQSDGAWKMYVDCYNLSALPA